MKAPRRIDVMRPWFTAAEAEAVRRVLESGWVAQGPETARFEEAFALTVQADHAVATSSCTAALHLALVVAGVGPGDEVIVPSFSFVATANAPCYVGAAPVFAEVELETGNLTAASVDAVASARTAAVIAVDQGGMPVDLEPLRRWCDRRGVVLIEDAACGIGSTYRGRPVGVGADISVWSFHPRKVITTGEGGMLTTNNPAWAQRAARLREHAMSVSAAERHEQLVPAAESYLEVGFNYRMTDLQATVGRVQLDKLPAILARRRELAARYTTALAGLPGLVPVTEPENARSNFQSYWVRLGAEYPLDRDATLDLLGQRGVSARRGIMAAHLHPAHATRRRAPLPVTELLTSSSLILPLHHTLSADAQARVIEALVEGAS